VTGERVVCRLLVGIEVPPEGELVWPAGGAFVGQFEPAPRLGDKLAQPVLQTARDDIAVDGFVVAAQEPRGVPGRSAASLPLVEDRVGHRRRMLEGGQQRRRQVRPVNGDRRTEPGMNDGRCGHGDLGRGRRPQPVHPRADGDLPESLDQSVQLTQG